ncbi:related to GTPase-activating protein gyp10 [Rhynchosporium graminicola]|uniref:Related to GTPase-activating protein gyp10 n=1 Tax=Rhynchosporium graminicola TaxID=2792576 RepID=A0A1E1KS49_9HELO|nr:related to GTPase-activating protein gyp10 [Rhynchosporium commune]
MDSSGSDHFEKRESHSPYPPSLSPTQTRYNAKSAHILEACEGKDLDALRLLAVSEGGLVSDEVRRRAWPILLGCEHLDAVKQELKTGAGDWKSFPQHRDEDQVRLDVDRSFIYYPRDQTPRDLELRKADLSDLITEVLRRQPYLSYFQGYHDICQVFLLVLEPHTRAQAVARLSALRIRDFMLPTFAQALKQLHLIPAIINTVNPQLRDHLSLTQPFFALSGTLTMYAHDIQEYGDISRLFDVLLAREAVFSVYMFAQIVLQRSDELFETPADEPEMLHSILSKLPKPLDIEALVVSTIQLFEDHPPENLRVWRSISSSSVLKTARWHNQLSSQSLEEGERYFMQQSKEIVRAERRKQVLKIMWKYRDPAGTVGLAIFIGVVSFWLRKSPAPSGMLGSLWRRFTGQ